MFNNSDALSSKNDSGAGGGAAPAQAGDAAKAGETPTFETWVAGQDETVKGLLESHTKGLKSALDAERETRKTFEKQIKDLAVKAEKGSEFEKQLQELSAQVDLTERRAAFYEEAQRQGVSNMKALFSLANVEGKFDRKGNADFAALKSEYPEFFVKPVPKGNAGTGNDGVPSLNNMNDVIRRMAGRK